ncbi:MAG: hypothetical protein D6768_17880 [Chloroflexi bacterium]|nr:MAG: hypothetical protein D6768_17880 [Chloroflexota bacterium]
MQTSQLLKLILFALLAGLVLSWPGAARADNPVVSVSAPTHQTGDAGAALGDVWDGSSTGEVKWVQPDASGRKTTYRVLNGVPGAYGTVLEGKAPTGSDLVSAFYTDSSVSLPSNVYKYLVLRSYIAPHQSGEAGIENTNGRVLYTSNWGSNWMFEALPFRRYSDSFAICGFGVWCTYFFDLTQTSFSSSTSPNPWDWGQSGARVEAFGIWPHENWQASLSNPVPSGDTPEYFYIDYMYLVGDIVTSRPAQHYTVRWQVSDVDGGSVTSTLYYQESNELKLPSQAPACSAATIGNWTAIPGGVTSVNLPGAGSYSHRLFLPFLAYNPVGGTFGTGIIPSANQSFDWDLSGGSYTEGKSYYVCVVANDGTGQSYAASSAPVIKVPPAISTIWPD